MIISSTLAENCDLINRGVTPKYSSEGETKLVKSAHVRTENIDWNHCPSIEDNAKYNTQFELRNGDILLNGTGTGSIGRPGIVLDKPHGRFFPDSHVNLIRVDASKLDAQFLFYWLNTSFCKNQLEKLITGSTNQVELSAKKVGGLMIPLVPLEDQVKSVNKLNFASKVIRLKKQQNKLLDELLKTSFIRLFGDPHLNEKNFPALPISDLGVVTTGNTPSRKNSNFYGDYIEWIKTDNITDQVYPSSASEYLSKEGLSLGRSVSAGSILVACIAGGMASIGKCALTNRRVSFNQQINAFTPGEKILSSYFYVLLKLAKDLVQNSSQSGMKKIVTKSNFEKIKIPVPPLSEQKKFDDIFNQYLISKAKLSESIEEVEYLFNSLVSSSFHE